jgi:hypothetical protein
LRRESIILKKIENHGIYGGLKEFAGREELFMLEDRKNSEEGYATLARNKMSQQNNNGESVSEHLLQKRPIPPIIIPERKAYHLSKPTSSKSSTAEAMAIVPVPSSRSSVRKQKPKIQKQPNIRDSFSQ